MDSKVANEVSLTDLFDQFIEASTMRNVLSIFHRILNYADLNPCEFNQFFPKLKRAVMSSRLKKNWKAKALFSKIDKKAAHRCYSNTKAPTPLGNRSAAASDNQQQSQHNSQEGLNDSLSSMSSHYNNNNALQHYNCLVIGSGPAGLRTAIELQLLGASRVVVVEKRSRFSRNNVLHLWPFVIDDLKSLGAKKFYGKFCAGSIDHISIRQLQLILLKICLMIGCDFRDSCSYLNLCPATIKQPTAAAVIGNNSDSTICDLYKEESSDFKKVSSSLVQQEEEENASKETTHDSKRMGEEKDCDEKEEEECAKKACLDKTSISTSDPSKSTSASDAVDGDGRDSLKLPSNNKCCQGTNVGRGENLHGVKAHFQSDYQLQEKELHSIEWDMIIGADGRRNTLSKFFPRKEFRGRLAIAITANFINRQTPAEASVEEISGLSFIYNQDMFNALACDTNIQLENICYYKDDTHYFVMTAKKKSLLERGVLIDDFAATQDLLSESNVDRQALLKYAKDAAFWTTGLEPLDFALNHYGQEDCAMFDFTSMYAASNACKALRTKGGGLALVSLVGDSLLEPFWPTGSGCARGFLSSFDAAWMCRQWAVNKCAVIDYHGSVSSRSSRNRSPANVCGPSTYNRMALSVMAERESIYRILGQTTSENLQQNYSHWTLNPHSRYPNLNRHLVIPSQVEHLITDNEVTPMKPEKSNKAGQRRIKSPNNNNAAAGGSVKLPKKLKSANASPVAQPKYPNNRSARCKTLGRSTPAYKSRLQRQEQSVHDTYLEFEKSYDNLADGGRLPYLNHHRPPTCGVYDDFFDSSVSGTLPSSNNLLSLEARRARDIDECLRQRRQKNQLHVVKNQLMEKFRGQSLSRDDDEGGTGAGGGGAALFNELRRLREQRAKGREGSKPRDLDGPLTLLNSMRRCASFAERVKSFESKMGHNHHQQQAESTPATPKIHIDNVKNLPQFGTLQELFVGNSTLGKNNEPKKSKIPIMKLSKDDWNVKCWEKRLAAYKQKTSGFSGSTKSLNRTTYEENLAAAAAAAAPASAAKPAKQVEVFKGRIKEMAEKLKKVRESDSKQGPKVTDENTVPTYKSNPRSQGWVSHLRRELIKGTEQRPQNSARPAMNPAIPNKPIKKLFADDEDEDDGIDINKHYDHLCVNRPTNKYLSKNGNYTSHLVRNKYNSATSKVVNVPQPSSATKQAYLNMLTSRGSSASSTLSDYSTNTGGSSSGDAAQQAADKELLIKCFRCKSDVSAGDKISIGSSTLHRNCLTCSACGITLRTGEIQHYLGLASDNCALEFICAICRPTMRVELNKEAAERLAKLEHQSALDDKPSATLSRLRSREEFLNEKINYNELYKNILSENSEAANKIERLKSSSSRETTPATLSSNQPHPQEREPSSETSKTKGEGAGLEREEISVSPITVTLPLRDSDDANEDQKTDGSTLADEPAAKDCGGYRIARSETIDGTEQVTLILPASIESNGFENERTCQERPMMDEDELERLLHPANPATNNGASSSSASSSNRQNQTQTSSSTDSDKEDESSDNENDERNNEAAELSDDSSSLISPTEDFDDDDDDKDEDEDDQEENDNVDQNSTYEDFLTSEEFGAVSDRENDDIPNDNAPNISVSSD